MKNKLLYWIPTALVSLMMLFSAYSYFTNPQVKEGFALMQLSADAFRIELAIAKILGAIVLLIPGLPKPIKEWTYAGFGITFISAFIMHLSVGDNSGSFAPIIALALLTVSRIFLDKK